MINRRIVYLYIGVVLVFFIAVVTSCRKDTAINAPDMEKAGPRPDSADLAAAISSSGNLLASSGTLTIKIKDSTFTFDAAHDSIAFINVHLDSNRRYYGITAINKAHTMSFGISSLGYVNNNVSNAIAGSQFLLAPDERRPVQGYSLSKYTTEKESSSINIVQYNQGKELAKGTFFTFLAGDDKPQTPYYKAEGSFDLQMK